VTAAVLGRRALNRALLHRQLLLRRHRRGALDVLHHLVGLQAQSPDPPYVGLWSRLEGFSPDELSGLVAGRQAVRVALMRSTIHLVTADDCLGLRPLVQPVLERGLKSNYGSRLAGLDMDAVAAAGRTVVEEQACTFSALGRRLAVEYPDRDPDALAMLVRTRVALVQVPPRGLWGRSGPSAHTSAPSWLGRSHPDAPITVDILVERYLAAFGPATVADMQQWSGLTRLREPVERLRPSLVTFRDERGVELYDLPGAPRPAPDIRSPARLLAGFDNVLLSHADRSRILGDVDPKVVMTPNGLVLGAVLLDGFVAGSWRLTRGTTGKTRAGAHVVVRTLGKVRSADRSELAAEARALLAFAAPDRTQDDVRFEVSSDPAPRSSGG
jgi:Winged helix DNA-binding domain